MTEEKTEYIASTDIPAQGKPFDAAQGKPIRCPECRLVIGHVVRREGIRNLRVEVGGFAFEMEGAALVWCPCGGLLTWHAGQEAIDRLIDEVKRKEFTAEYAERRDE